MRGAGGAGLGVRVRVIIETPYAFATREKLVEDFLADVRAVRAEEGR